MKSGGYFSGGRLIGSGDNDYGRIKRVYLQPKTKIMAATSTVVEVTCTLKKEQFQYGNIGSTKETEIGLTAPYDPASSFYKYSRGTDVVLKTTNQEVADMFALGGAYVWNIAPKEISTPVE